ncbi:hypothetical protein GCM10018966_015580 [Streptomyces yanii]
MANRFAARRNRQIGSQLHRRRDRAFRRPGHRQNLHDVRDLYDLAKRKIMSAIHPKITDVLTNTFKVPAAEILPGSTMDSLEMDSLAVAEFAVIIKETLGVEADSDKLYKDATLADITTFIDAAVGGDPAMSNAR